MRRLILYLHAMFCSFFFFGLSECALMISMSTFSATKFMSVYDPSFILVSAYMLGTQPATVTSNGYSESSVKIRIRIL